MGPLESYQPTTEDQKFFAISPLMVFPRTKGDFGIYLKIRGRFMLYAHPEEPFTETHRQRLHSNGVEEIYVLTNQREQFESYLDKHLGDFLMDDSLPMKERSRVYYSASMDVMKTTFQSRLPGTLGKNRFDKIAKLVRAGAMFLLKDKSFKNLASFISHDYQTWSHCVHVFVFSQAMLQTYDLDVNSLFNCGVGAILHDIGKLQIRKSLLFKKGRLNKEERQEISTHPVLGVATCAGLPLHQESINCVLFHHERIDGTGYPSGMAGEEIPLPVKVVTVCDVYAALTTDRPYAKARAPFEALRIMKEGMQGHFDEEVFKRLVLVLSGADIV
jgi:HD-GYP domain-containing protein (c-di-GMP phosphodiesterase class II)